MATQVQFRRGTTSENNSFTGVVGEITVDTTVNQIRVHDGTTAGGHRAGFETNTSMIFYQSAAPTGWTKDTAATLNDHAIRLVTSTAWASGTNGANAFSAGLGASSGGTDTESVSSGNDSHTHQLNDANTGGSPASTTFEAALNSDSTRRSSQSSGAGSSHEHAMNLNVKYINVIRATKD